MKAEFKRTNIILNNGLVQKALKKTGLKSQRAVIDYALQELIRREGQKELLQFRGKLKWEGDLTTSRQGRNPL